MFLLTVYSSTEIEKFPATGKRPSAGCNGQRFYLDRSGAEFGPFRSDKMRAWFAHGYFPIGDQLIVRLESWKRHSAATHSRARSVSGWRALRRGTPHSGAESRRAGARARTPRRP
eukprot:s4328_g1.t1